jgi:hypothetical protein
VRPVSWEVFERGAKILGVAIPLIGFIAWLASRASASDVAANTKDIAAIKEERQLEREYDLAWKKWAGEQLGQIGVSVRASVAPPPAPPPVKPSDEHR